MKKVKPIITRTPTELAEAMGLTAADGAHWVFRSQLTDKIIEIVKKRKLTHASVAKLAQVSRTRVTAILNRNLQETSTDQLIRILGALGLHIKAVFELAA